MSSLAKDTAPANTSDPSAQPAQLDLFQQRLPAKPYCSDDKTAGLIRVQWQAIHERYIQANPPPLLCWLLFDVDAQDAAGRWMDAMLPPPAWVAQDPVSGHAHVSYGIAAPVCRTEAARQGPLRLAAAIEQAYCTALGADEGYSALITKNPVHPAWRVWMPPAANAGVYELAELADYVDLPKLDRRRRGAGIRTSIGRNVELFDRLRTWAYSAVRSYWAPDGYERWHAAVAAKAEALNDFPNLDPLPPSEIQATAKSVAKWVWQRFTPGGLQDLIERTHTPERQAERGRQKGRRKREALQGRAKELHDAGWSHRAIAKELGVTHPTVANWVGE